ncbi:MAG: hypothetical protein AAF721_21975 [Myxococcota bacterium]
MDVTSRLASAPVLCGFALLAGLLQIGASIQLGLARLQHLQAAAVEGSMYYVLGAFAAVLGLTVVWLLRRRPIVAVGALLVWQAAVFFPLRSKTTALGLSYHGEYILHHFTALVAAAALATVAWRWANKPEFGSLRLIPGSLGGAAAAVLLVVHIWNEPGLGGEPPAGLQHVGVALGLGAWAAAVGVLWPRLGEMRMRVVSAALLLPYVLRVAFAWPEGLIGASVFDVGRPWVMAAMVAAALVTFVGYRPRMPRPYVLLVSGLAGILTLILYIAYTHRFGDYEAGLGGLVQSMFAFTPPYPTYVPRYQVLIVLLGVFGIVSSAYGGLVTPGERVRGVALALLLTAGLGLATPALSLMTFAAAFTWLDAGTKDPRSDGKAIPAPTDVQTTLEAVADALALSAPVILETERGTIVAVRGELEDVTLDLRARPLGGARLEAWELQLQLGVLGRDRPQLELIPDVSGGGSRPSHAIGATHRVRGSLRDVESLDDTLLDALQPFATARTELWSDGSRVRFGGDLSAVECGTLATLARALARRE